MITETEKSELKDRNISSANGTTSSPFGSDLIKLQRLETISQAAGGIVHDLNNILMCLDGEVCMLKKKLSSLPADSDIDESLSSLLSIIQKGHKLTNHLLRIGKGQKPDTAPTAIGETIREAVMFSLLGTHLSSNISIPNDLRPIQTNEEQIFQLVTNLVINARHATSSAKNTEPINITASNLTECDVINEGLTPGKYIRICIEDHGEGIPAGQINRIFDPFFTTKTDGTGLGLALVKQIIKDLSGYVKVDSTEGKGSRFTVFIPALDFNTSGEISYRDTIC